MPSWNKYFSLVSTLYLNYKSLTKTTSLKYLLHYSISTKCVSFSIQLCNLFNTIYIFIHIFVTWYILLCNLLRCRCENIHLGYVAVNLNSICQYFRILVSQISFILNFFFLFILICFSVSFVSDIIIALNKSPWIYSIFINTWILKSKKNI